MSSQQPYASRTTRGHYMLGILIGRDFHVIFQASSQVAKVASSTRQSLVKHAFIPEPD